ncbi:zf-HC2 domain-containing protein [Faecalibaculum rodentium]|uniref:zf-HC2 domain-containing protein n=1 Tax=Faecalibaculum rodentium TaxID=1702221 RepID=UPI00259BBC79|nr:zf-HC2 domain-containing protein [Faecalibaculum rodentium]
MTENRKTECAIVQDLLPLYADGVVQTETAEWIQRHLETCPACREELQNLQKPDPAVLQKDLPLEKDLKKTGRHLRWSRRIMVVSAVLFVLLALLAGAGWRNSILLPADYVKVMETGRESGQLVFEVQSQVPGTGLLNLQSSCPGDGTCELEVRGGSGLLNRMSRETVSVPDTTREIRLNGEILWQDGVMISPRCRQLYSYANGYAGDVQQMHLAAPPDPDLPVTIEADTEDPAHCGWTYRVEAERRLPAESLREAAWLAMVLTPNLDKVTYRFDREEPLVFTRQALAETLGHKPDIESPADLQRIMNRILPAAG